MNTFFRFRIFFATTLLLSLLSGCAATREPLIAAPPADRPFRSEQQIDISSISVNFETTAEDLAKLLNQSLGRDLYSGPVRNSGITATVRRNGPIGITMSGDYIHMTMPATVSLGYSIFKVPEFSTGLTFKIRPSIGSDWKISADVHYTGLENQLAEEVRLGPITVQLRSTVEGAVHPLQKSLSSLVTAQVNKQFPLRQRLEKIWLAAQTPILLDRKYGAWLKLVPKEIKLTPLRADGNRARLAMGLITMADLTVGREPAREKPSPLPPLQKVNSMERSFRLSLRTELYYRELVDILSPLLIGKDFGSDGNSVLLKSIDLYGNGDSVIVRLETTGSLAGTFYLSGKPRFDPVTNRFTVEEVDFDMNTESMLLTSADWFLHGSIRERIREKLNMDLTQRVSEARDLAQKGLVSIPLADHLVLRGNIRDLGFRGALVLKDRITLQLYAEGETSMVLK